ncbi:RidA family protein [Streptomyces mayteni]
MAITLLNPEGLPKIDLYRQVSVASGSKMVFVSGQVSWDENQAPIGEGDLVAQVERCYLNVALALAAAGATFDDVAKLNVYVVDLTPDKLPQFLEGAARAAAKLEVTPVPPITVVGVTALDVPEHLVEIEATAFLD